jgi:hypothetical protein
MKILRFNEYQTNEEINFKGLALHLVNDTTYKFPI